MKKIVVVLILLIVVFTGCKKDETTPATSKCLLTKYTLSEEGDDFVVNFEYDVDKKLMSYSATDDDFSQVTFQYNSEGYVQSYTGHYDGVEDERADLTWNGNTLNVTFFNYDSGTWVIDDYKYIYKLNSNGNIIREEYHDMDDNGIWTIRDYSTYEWSNGNIKKREYWKKNNRRNNRHCTFLFRHILNDEEIPTLKSVTDDFELYSSTTIEYDDKENAMFSLKAIPMFWVTKNNGVSSITHYTSGETHKMTATYEYNEKGYPIKQTQTYDGEDPLIISFEYDCD